MYWTITLYGMPWRIHARCWKFARAEFPKVHSSCFRIERGKQ